MTSHTVFYRMRVALEIFTGVTTGLLTYEIYAFHLWQIALAICIWSLRWHPSLDLPKLIDAVY